MPDALHVKSLKVNLVATSGMRFGDDVHIQTRVLQSPGLLWG